MEKRKKEIIDLAAAVRYNEEGYRLLTEAGRKEAEADLQGMQHDLKRARLFFKLFEISARRVENLERAAVDLQRRSGTTPAYVVNMVNNELNL